LRWRAKRVCRLISCAAPALQDAARAILAGGVIGIAAIYSDELIKIGGQTLTANIVTMAVFGAILMYIMAC
jgi:ethanolamine permease